jgi:thioredoxin 2
VPSLPAQTHEAAQTQGDGLTVKHRESKNVMAEFHRVVCPHCAATNRIPTGKPANEARCGACHQALFDGHPTAVDAAGFEKHRRDNDIPVLLDVWAPWCGPCRGMAPMFERAALELEPDVRLIKLNADDEPRVSSQLSVSGIPALFLLRGGRVVAQTAGAMDARHIVAWVRSRLAEAA